MKLWTKVMLSARANNLGFLPSCWRELPGCWRATTNASDLPLSCRHHQRKHRKLQSAPAPGSQTEGYFWRTSRTTLLSDSPRMQPSLVLTFPSQGEVNSRSSVVANYLSHRRPSRHDPHSSHSHLHSFSLSRPSSYRL